MPTSIKPKLSRPINSADHDLKAFLNDLQGNILKGHGRDHTVNCFLRFDGDGAAIAAALSRLAAGGFITSAAQQLAATEARKHGGPDDVPVAFLFLTATGYDKLGVPTDRQPSEDAFREGLEARKDKVDDDPETWDPRYRDGIDALLLVAMDTPSNDETGAAAHADVLLSGLSPAGATEVLRVVGQARRNDVGEGIEHFGYVDGRSQPLLLLQDVETEILENGGADRWDPAFRPLDTVLVPDGLGADPDTSFGSYFVFRQLEQNVKAFKQNEGTLADALGLTGADRERAGALAVGRFEDGTPLILDQSAVGGAVRNNFNYGSDPEGRVCPFHAHIRKTNPRGDVRSQFGLHDDTGDRRPIMARRGITYGDRTDDPNDGDIATKPETGNGLLFMAYQTSIERQFEFTQKSWANNGNFVKNQTGLDPVIGQGARQPFSWPTTPGQPGTVTAAFDQHVKMLGGAYFFAPAISAIRALATAAAPAQTMAMAQS